MNGILLVDKPIEWTSHDVVNFLRLRLKIKKIGHAGTLDPIATGLLVHFLGASTKKIRFYEDDAKEYLAVMALGYDTFTHDGTGTITRHTPVAPISRKVITGVFESFLGTIQQTPPLISAVKQKGVRSYKLAKQGISIDLEPRERYIHHLSILSYDFPLICFKILCSKGTYVRKLCSDIGDALGCSAYLSSLMRTASGMFHLRNALSISELRRMSREEIFSHVITDNEKTAV